MVIERTIKAGTPYRNSRFSSPILKYKTYCEKAENGEETMFVEGYANTKNNMDRYGETPTVYGDRDFVYELGFYKMNPVILLDHYNSVENIVGKAVEVKEDNVGLFVKIQILNDESQLIKTLKNQIKQGMIKTLSIAGRFYYEDEEHPHKLTLADIYEISLVAVPADPHAIVDLVKQSETEPDGKTKSDNLHLAKQGLDKILTGLKEIEEERRNEKLKEISEQLKDLGVK